jgi:transposase InsO family protein
MSDLISAFVMDDSALSVSGACRALSLPRSTWCRLRSLPAPLDRDPALRDHIQRLALERPTYGYRRITHQLGREAILVNHKRVLRLMRDDNLLCLRHKSFLVTTDSDHALPVYPNLAAGLAPDGPVRCLERGIENLLHFLLCPQARRKAVRTTNYIERLIRELRRRTRPMGAFADRTSCDRLPYGVVKRLDDRWSRRTPLPELTHKA